MPGVSVTADSVAYALAASGAAVTLVADDDGMALATIGLIGVDGIGMAPLHRLSERSPAQHGATDRGFRLDPRVVALVFRVNAVSYSALDDAKDQLYRIFRPRDTALILTYTKENGDARAIGCHTLGDLQFAQSAPQGTWLTVGVKLGCPDPLWYDPIAVAITFGAAGATTGMAIPWLIPWKLGATSLNQSRTIAYDGTFATLPTVRIQGPVTSPIVTNTITGDKLDFTGTTIAGGSYYQIDCAAGTVVDSSGTNQISKLTTDSDLTTFSLEATGDGVNTISVSGTGVSSATEVYLSFYTRYAGA